MSEGHDAFGGAGQSDSPAGSPSPVTRHLSPSFEHGHSEYSDAELLEQAHGNAQALILATLAFLEGKGISSHEWAAAIGETFSQGWGDPRPWDAAEFLDAMLTNLRAFGADVVSAELGIERAEAAMTGFPDPELCEQFGIAPEQAAVFHEAAGRIAAPRGLRWSWELTPEGVTRFVVERIGDGEIGSA